MEVLPDLRIDTVTIAFAFLGGAFGLYVGERLRQYSPTAHSAPGMLSILGAVFAATFAYTVLWSLIAIGLFGGAGYMAWKCREPIIAASQQLSARYVMAYEQRTAAKDLARTVRLVECEHQQRIQTILAMDVTEQQLQRFLDDEELRYQNELHDTYYADQP